jgi:hypothetical protein
MEQQVNLYQPILGAEKRLFSGQAIAIGLAVLALSLVGLAAFAALRTARVERSVALVEKEVAAQVALAEKSGAVLTPKESLAELEATARDLSAQIASRERALDVIKKGAAAPGTGFSARLEALARAQVDGLWLTTIVVSTGEGALALEGQTTDARLVPAYLAALGEEHAFERSRSDRLVIRRAKPEEAPASAIFELGAPGLSLPVPESKK